jgi:hypothetical protein
MTSLRSAVPVKELLSWRRSERRSRRSKRRKKGKPNKTKSTTQNLREKRNGGKT